MLLSGADAQAQWGNRAPGAPPQAQAQTQPQGTSQGTPPGAPPPGSRGENFSANKSPAQLFTSDCTGSGCHRGPQGLSKDRGQSGLASFLREHYTNSRESASALAAYLVSLPAAARPDPKPARAAKPEDGTKPAGAPRPATAAAPADGETKPAAKPGPRGRQATGPAAAPAAPAPAPVEAAPVPAAVPAPPPEPPKPQWDIFD